jgi:hypothetical protein
MRTPSIASVFSLQYAGWTVAVIAAVVTALFIGARGPDGLLGAERRPRPPLRRELAAGRHVLTAALLTVCLAGLIIQPIDAVLIFGGLVLARPTAAIVAERLRLAAITSRLPMLVRLALAVAVGFGIAFLIVPAIFTPNDPTYLSVILGLVPGLFAAELLLVDREARPDEAATPAISPVAAGTLGALALLAISSVLPAVVLADNCSNPGDCYGLGAGAAAAAGGAGAALRSLRKPSPRPVPNERYKADYFDKQIQNEKDNPKYPDDPKAQKRRNDYLRRMKKYWSNPDNWGPRSSDDKPTSPAAYPSSGAATKA